jgi:hypothetical protein
MPAMSLLFGKEILLLEVTGPLYISKFTRFDRRLPLWLKAVTFLVN